MFFTYMARSSSNAYKNLTDFDIYCIYPGTIVQVLTLAAAIYVPLKALLFRILGDILVQGLDFATVFH